MVPPRITYSVEYIWYKKNVVVYLKLVTNIFCVLKKPVYAIKLHFIHLEWLRFPPRAENFEAALLKRREILLLLR